MVQEVVDVVPATVAKEEVECGGRALKKADP